MKYIRLYIDDNFDKRNKRGLKKYCYNNGEHIPNKNEAKLLRKLKQKTGLTEIELRQHKKYRKMLSNAQVAGQKVKNQYSYLKPYFWILRSILCELKLPKEHPLVKERLRIGLKTHTPWHTVRFNADMLIHAYKYKPKNKNGK